MNKAILLTIGLMMSVLCFAQETVIIGTGTSSQYIMPINRAANYAASEMIYLQSEIGYAGDIEKISFYKASGLTSVTIENINIYMKHTSSSALATGNTSLTGYTLVYSGTYPNSISKGWIEITLSTPFNYNNTDNLQLFITKGYQASVTTQPYYSYTSTGSYNRSRYYSNSTVAWNDRASLTASTQRPNIQLYVTPLIECDSTTFIDAGSVSPISTTLYNNYVASLNLPNYTFLGGLDFEWQKSTVSNSEFTQVLDGSGDGTSRYKTGAMYDKSFYRCKVTCLESGEFDYSSTATINVRYRMFTGSYSVCDISFYDNGGPLASYNSNLNDTITFCSGNDTHMQLNFTQFNTETNSLTGRNEIIFDYLDIYDGPDLTYNKLFHFAGQLSDTNKLPIIISTNECLTMHFVSNSSITKVGWTASVLCTEDENKIPSQFCNNAPSMCEDEQFTGSTSSFYNIERVDGQLEDGRSFPAVLDNNSFLQFFASNDTAKIILDVSNCSSPTCGTATYGGIEIAVYSGIDCENLTRVSNSIYANPGFGEGLDTLYLYNLSVGGNYYIVIDGRDCSTCDYEILIESGIQCCADTYISGDTLGIIGSTVQLTANAFSNNKTPWVSSNTSVATISATGVVTPQLAGTTTITYRDDYGCYPTLLFTVEVADLVVSETVVNIDENNEFGSITLTPSGGKAPYSYLWFPDVERPDSAEFAGMFDTIPLVDSLNINLSSLYQDYLTLYSQNSISDLKPGQYSCLVKDVLGDSVLYTGAVTANVRFDISNGILFQNNSIVITDTISNDTVTFAFANKFVIEDKNYISFQIGQDNLNAKFGLSYNALNLNGDTVFNEYFTNDYGLTFIDGEVFIHNFNSIDTTGISVSEGDTISINSDGEFIKIQINDSIVDSTTYSLKSTAAPVLTTSSTGVIFANYLTNANIARSISSTITNSFCHLPSTSSIKITPTGYNSVTYNWNGPGAFTGNQAEYNNLDPGKYTVTVQATYGSPAIGFSRQYSYIIGNYTTWMTNGLEVQNINQLSSTVYNNTDMNANNALSINQIQNQNNADNWCTFKLNLDQSSLHIFVIGFNELNNPNNSEFPIQNGAVIFHMPINSTSNPILYEIEDGTAQGDYIDISLNSTICFNLNYVSDLVSCYKIDNNQMSQLLFSSALTQNEVYIPSALVVTENTTIQESISTFCFSEKCSYAVPQRELTGAYVYSSCGKLRFKYDEEYFTGTNIQLDYKIYNLDNFDDVTPTTTSLVNYGDNRFIINLLTGFTINQSYLLEITNSKKEKRYLKFIYKESSYNCNCID